MSPEILLDRSPEIIQSNLLGKYTWQGQTDEIVFDEDAIKACLLDLDQSYWVICQAGKVGISRHGSIASATDGQDDLASALLYLPPLPYGHLGDAAFRAAYGTRAAFYAGAMAGGLSSEEMIISLGKAGLMGSFGSGGCLPSRIEDAIQRVKAELGEGPYIFNLLNSPNEPALEKNAVDLYLKHKITAIEASAYLDMTFNLVRYRAAGLSLSPEGKIVIGNRIIAKISRKEIAKRFMSPAPEDILVKLVSEGQITEQQANLSRQVPMADDVTVEADSGGHTDNRPLVCLIPVILATRDEVQAKYNYPNLIRIGAAGGISTPAAALAAFTMGAAYVVTGSINQACVESAASEHTRNLLSQISMTDVMMAPAADMFEMGVKVQVLKRGSMFPMRALKLHELYTRYNSIDEIPVDEREKLEKTVFQRDMESIWHDTVRFFSERDPRQIERADKDAKAKMALIFRWYLGLSSRWSSIGESGREMDYQIWCGPAMGAFNDWVKGTYLEKPENRHVLDVTTHILTGAAYLARVRSMAQAGVPVSPLLGQYQPVESVA